MFAKVQAFNTENNNLPLKAAGAFVGAALGAMLVAVALTLIESEEAYAFDVDEAPAPESVE